MASSKAFLLLGVLLSVVLLISSQVSAIDSAETKESVESNGIEDAKYRGPGYGNPRYGNPGYGNPRYGNPGYGNPRYGNPGYGNPGYGNPGYSNPGYGNPGRGGYPPRRGCQYGCCRGYRNSRGCRDCCQYAGQAPYEETVAQPHN